MNKNRKTALIIPCSILALAGIGYAGYEFGKNTDSTSSSLVQSKQSKHIAYADKVSDIVVTEITEDGYVTLHGDHSHYEKGLVPYNAKFLDKLVYNDKNYKLKDEDIQYEVAQGYIIKVNGKYYYYPKEGIKQSNIVDEETAKTISASSHSHHHEKTSTHEDNYQFNPKDIVKETADGYVVRHGDHYHFIKKSDLSAAQLNSIKQAGINNETPSNTAGITHATSDGYIFKGESDIIGHNSFGFIVKHGSHNHIISFDSLRGTKWEYLINKYTSSNNHSNSHSNTTSPEKSTKITKDVQDKIDYLSKILNIDKSKIKIIETTKGLALTYPHGDHTHTVFLDEIHIGDDSNLLNDEIEKQIEYIADVYGVPKKAIKVTKDFFIFNEPTQEYDPTHIHPYLIPRSKFRIPEVTGDKELDFEQELLALSERTGIAPDKIQIDGDKFVIPHGSHNHYVKIKSGGAEAYLKNKIPNIIGTYIKGEFDKNTVINRINSLIADNNQLNKDKKQVNRINRALYQLKNSIEELPTNSTAGYLAMLDSFDKKYIHINSSATDKKDEKFIKQYDTLLNRVKNANIEHLGYDKESLIEELNAASSEHNTDAFTKIEHILNELEKFDLQTGPTILSYTKYFLENINSNKIDNELREELAYLIEYSYLSEAKIIESRTNELIARLINAKNKLYYQLQHNNVQEVKYGENYAKLSRKYNNDDEMSILDSAKSFIKELEDFLPTLEFSKINNSNELTTKIKNKNSENSVIKNNSNSAEKATNNTNIDKSDTISSDKKIEEKEANSEESLTDDHRDDEHDFSFNTNDVLEETTDGFIVKHGDHKHYVDKKNLTALQIKQAQEFLKKSK
ncbi:streptococcal histidine triad protein [Gemella morbillorum]|uniref:pneumococcal-type histidine triad protein n=1 Tax=Gemella morbillorum TaxID=29391 RepID=UPI000DA362FA|nr:pneumococcal-type histidine triad protein [Gemella morbillorum]UBH80349.1 pneumococcal-type histidine triad protein [Gemella morbillorum]SQH55739.1 streptococcal histidine triad protein [Gemella morbillorum]